MASIISTNITRRDRPRIHFAFQLAAVPELDTILCHPEIAPHAMVTT